MSKTLSGIISKEGVSIPLIGSAVFADIIGRGCKVKVIQTFKNNEENPIEAVYKFPLPENCAVCGFSVKTGDKVIVSDIEERDKAFELYDEALTDKQGAYLLDEERPNIFTLSVGNLLPDTTVTIEIDYVTLLDTFDSEVRFYLPTTISPRYVPKDTHTEGIPEGDIVNPPFASDVSYGLKVLVNIHDKESISSIESPSHHISTDISNNITRVTFSSETVKMDRDFVLTIRHKKGFESRGYIYEDRDDAFIQIDLAASLEDNLEEVANSPKEIIFVLDCSGSMSGSSIEEAKKAIEILIKALTEDVRFNIYRFGSDYTKLFDTSVPYNDKNVSKALNYITKIDADMGGTEVLSPLKDIYRQKVEGGNNRNIVLITDGEVGNETEVISLIKDGRDKNRLFTVGVGYGPNEYFIKQTARISKGVSEQIAPNERIEPKVLRLFKKLLTFHIDNLKIHLPEGFQQAPKEPAVYHEDRISIFARARSSADIPEVLRITAEINNKPLEWDIALNKLTDDSLPVPQFWGQQRIRDLEEGIWTGSLQGDRKNKAVKEEIIRLSKGFSVISRETSFIAIEKRGEDERSDKEIVLRKIPVMITKDWGGMGKIGLPLLSVTPFFAAGISAGAVCASAFVAEPFNVKQFSRSSKNKPDNMIIHLLDLQRHKGGFVADDHVAKMLKTTVRKLEDISKLISTEKTTDNFILLSTAIVLAILESEFNKERSMWEMIIEKSNQWLQTEIRNTKAKINEIELLKWVEDYVNKNLR